MLAARSASRRRSAAVALGPLATCLAVPAPAPRRPTPRPDAWRPCRAARAVACAVALGALLEPSAGAQAPAEPDTTRALAEIAVSGAAPEAAATVRRISAAAVRARDPASVADLAALAPSATVRTNSRGEALVYLRGSGERQVTVFFDGAPLTVPWDRRVDLGLLPAGLVGEVAVAQGASSVVWGPNALGGAVDLRARALEAPGALSVTETSLSFPLGARAATAALWSDGRRSLSAAADAEIVPGGEALATELPFSQSGALRTNTDRSRRGGAVRAGWRLSPRTELGATLLGVDGSKGVAPESHLDPAEERVRFWRYGAVQSALAVARLRHAAPAGSPGRVTVDASAWASAFGQRINQFESDAYDALADRQRDRDLSAGARLVATAATPVGTLTGAAFGFGAEHAQTEGLEAVGDGLATETFRHAEWSVGAEWERRIVGLTLSAGSGLDGLTPTETAGRASAGAFRAYAAHGGARLQLTERWALRGGGGRKARFPSMRELFGEALGRFALNPDLGPETARLAEVAVEHAGPRLAGELVAFGRWTDGTIEQERLDDGRRRRVNLGASRVLGLEASGAARRGALRLDAAATLLALRATDGDGAPAVLTETPDALARLSVSYAPASGLGGALELVGTGAAVSLGPGGAIDLAPSLRVGARLGWRAALAGVGLGEAFVRVDNAFDVASFPQAGLPLPGRTLRVGLRVVR